MMKKTSAIRGRTWVGTTAGALPELRSTTETVKITGPEEGIPTEDNKKQDKIKPYFYGMLTD